tara:strand:+ start:2209 stop:2436 length:228 start_codon:yes stop_codon:yes gene_type:complete
MNDDLLNPEDSDAPIMALVGKNPADMTDSELAALTTKLRNLRTNGANRKKETKIASDRKSVAKTKVNVNLQSLFE